MKKFVCPVCGYVHEGESAPEKCPVCGVPLAMTEGSVNGSFDQGEFEHRKRGEGR